MTDLRRAACRVRRSLLRLRRRHPNTTEEAEEDHRRAKKGLREEIKKAKREAWDRLIEDLDANPWGRAYQIVMKRFCKGLPKLSRNQTARPVATIFPVVDLNWSEIESAARRPFTNEGLRSATRQIGTHKNLGLDEVSGALVNSLVTYHPWTILEA